MRWITAVALALMTGAGVASDIPLGCTLVYPGSTYVNGRFGPFDYLDPANKAKNLPIVENHHFDAGVESLRRGMTAEVGADIEYTLHAFPNHHRALQAAANLAFRERRDKPTKMEFSIECYFLRGISYSPTDGTVKMLYGNYLARNGKVDAAIAQYERALNEDELKDANLYYALGLAYFRKGNMSKSLENARKAYALGYPLPALRQKLENAGHWAIPN